MKKALMDLNDFNSKKLCLSSFLEPNWYFIKDCTCIVLFFGRTVHVLMLI